MFSFDIKYFLRTFALFFFIAVVGHFIAYNIIHIPTQTELVIILSIALFYPIIRRPVIGIYLLFCFMPFIPFLRRLYYLQHQRPSVDPLIAVGDILITITFIGLFFVFREQKDQENKTKIISSIVLSYFVYLIIRTFFLNILSTMDAVMRLHFYGPSVLFFFIGILYAKDSRLLKNIWFITIGIGILSACYGLKQLLFGYSEAEQLWFSSISFTTLFIKGLARPFSFFQSPASFADFMLLAIVGTLLIVNWGKNLWRYALLVLLPLFFYGALITSVRSNWIGIILALALWIGLLQIKGSRNRFLMIFILSLVFIFIQILDFTVQYNVGLNSVFSLFGGAFNQQQMDLLVTERTGAIANPFEEYSFLSRIALWKLILVMSRQPFYALIGRGIGAFPADSLYFTYLAELGYPGLIVIVGLIVFLIYKGFVLIDRGNSLKEISLAKGITLMNIVFAVVNITGTHVHSFPGDIYFWFWNGVLVKLVSEPSLDTQPVSNETIDNP